MARDEEDPLASQQAQPSVPLPRGDDVSNGPGKAPTSPQSPESPFVASTAPQKAKGDSPAQVEIINIDPPKDHLKPGHRKTDSTSSASEAEYQKLTWRKTCCSYIRSNLDSILQNATAVLQIVLGWLLIGDPKDFRNWRPICDPYCLKGFDSWRTYGLAIVSAASMGLAFQYFFWAVQARNLFKAAGESYTCKDCLLSWCKQFGKKSRTGIGIALVGATIVGDCPCAILIGHVGKNLGKQSNGNLKFYTYLSFTLTLGHMLYTVLMHAWRVLVPKLHEARVFQWSCTDWINPCALAWIPACVIGACFAYSFVTMIEGSDYQDWFLQEGDFADKSFAPTLMPTLSPTVL